MPPTSDFAQWLGKQFRMHQMEEDDECSPDAKNRKRKPNMPALPAQLGQKLRALFADVETQPVPDRLIELLEALAAKDKQPE